MCQMLVVILEFFFIFKMQLIKRFKQASQLTQHSFLYSNRYAFGVYKSVTYTYWVNSNITTDRWNLNIVDPHDNNISKPYYEGRQTR